MKVIYPGSFDPITIGHLDIIKRLNKMFDEVVIAILINEAKHSLFSIKERKQLIENEIKEFQLDNVKVKTFEGLLVDFAKKENSKIIVRGLRAVTDYEYEMNIAQFNSSLYEDLETIFLLSDPKFSFISSSGVRELASFGGDVSKFVSKNVKKAIYEKNKLGGKKLMANINELIDEIEDIMDNASSVPFSRKVSVDPDEIFEIVRDMRDSLPTEIKNAQWINDEKERILQEAENEARSKVQNANNEIKNFKEQAKSQYQRMISEHQITAEARQEAQRILEQANQEANKIKQQSYQYIDQLFTKSCENFSQLAQSLEKNKQHILNQK